MINAILPEDVSIGASEVDDWNTQSNVLPNGKQTRIARQSRPISKMTINYETQTEAQHIALRNFKLSVQGSAIAFLAKFWGDYKSDTAAPGQDCSPATGDAANLAFQLQKTYTAPSGGTARVRTITKPKSGTVSVYVNGVLQTLTTHYTIDHTTGIITFVVAPANGHTVKATFEFYKPCHFVNDDNPVEVEQDAGALSIFHHSSMEIEEVDEI